MRFFKEYKNIIAIVEKSAGNESVDSEWLDTKSFPKETPIPEIIEWAKDDFGSSGRLIITIDETDAKLC